MKKKFSEMQGHMQDQMNQQQGGYTNQTQPEPKPAAKSTKEDYIDFEEIK